MGRLHTGQGLPVRLSWRAQRKQHVWCPVVPCTILAFFGRNKHTTHAAADDFPLWADDGKSVKVFMSEPFLFLLLSSNTTSAESSLVSIVVTSFSEVLTGNLVSNGGISTNCTGISTPDEEAGLHPSMSWPARQLSGDIIPESKLARALRLSSSELCVSTTLGESLCWCVIGRLLVMLLPGSQSGRRFQQKSQYLCRALFSLLHSGHTHLSCHTAFTHTHMC